MASASFGLDDAAWATASGSALTWLTLGTVALLAVPVFRVLARLEGEQRSRALWMLGGSLLAFGPILAAEPSVRVLGVVTVGVSAWVGLAVDGALGARDPNELPTAALLGTGVAVLLRSNHLQNGLLLTKEFHTLFDLGYVTVTPDYVVRVSPALSKDWRNGRRYYPYDGKRLVSVPKAAPLRPSASALSLHNETVFRRAG